jgi:hypothetical protein
MEDDFNILVGEKNQCNEKNIKDVFVFNFKEQHSTVTSRQPDEHNNQ